MANNRMFLIHRPTKLGIMLGKRVGWGWYEPPSKDRLQKFYDCTIECLSWEGHQDDFILAMEDCSGSSCFGDWTYTGEEVDGFGLFEFTKENLK